MYLRLVVLMNETLVVYNIPSTDSAELIKSTASVKLMSLQRTWAWQPHSQSSLTKKAWVTARPKLIKEHFGNNEDMLFSYRAPSEQVDPALQSCVTDSFTNLKPQRKLSEIPFGLPVFEKLNSQTILPPSCGWTSLICLFHIQNNSRNNNFVP